MGLFKVSPEKTRATAVELIGEDEQIQALTRAYTGGMSGPAGRNRYIVAATDRNVYLIFTPPRKKHHRIEEKFPLSETRAEMVFLGFTINDTEFSGENFWKNESKELVEYIHSHGAPAAATAQADAS
jgi:hypothetical protein